MSLSVWEAVLVLLAGVGAGTINTVVGSGTLISFPVLLAIGLPPVEANVSNSLGLVPGSVSGAIGYRAELRGQRRRILRLGLASLVGGIVGAVLLLVLPPGAFDTIVPVLIGLGVVLVVAGPWISRRAAASAVDPEQDAGARRGPRWLWPAVAGTGVYGGYFGAAQGVILMAVMGIGVDDTLQRINATKNVLAAIVNGVAAVVFIGVALVPGASVSIDWLAALLLAVGSVLGGQLGARVGRRLPPLLLRAVIVVVGIAALVSFFV